MCGIAGLSMSHEDRWMNAADVAESLLMGIASRGPNATGAAWHDLKDDTVSVTKVPVPAWRFIEARKDVLPDATPVMLLHTRFATHGGTDNRLNNHPVVHGDIIGVHNGVLSNHTEMFKHHDRKPTSSVDTEALMMLLDLGKPAVEVLGELRGDAAIAWIDLKEPDTLHLANVVGRPLHIAQTEQGSLLFASTKATLDSTAKENKLKLVFYKEVPEETYLRVRYGVITDWLKIENVFRPSYEFSSKYAWTSGTGGDADKGKKSKYTPKVGSPKAVEASVESAPKAIEAAATDTTVRTGFYSDPAGATFLAEATDAELIRIEESTSPLAIPANRILNERILIRLHEKQKERDAARDAIKVT